MNKESLKPLSDQIWSEDEPVLVSVFVAAYNHAKFIEDALKGFLIQETNFRVEVLINEDCSTDNTAEILKRYEKEHPDLFKVIYQTVNQYSQGIKPFFHILPKIAKGKYIAICEGDDYWTDPLKLQKQVDFLGANEEYGICGHKTLELNEINKEHSVFPSIEANHIYTIHDYIQSNYTATCSIVFRNNKLLGSLSQNAIFGDWYIAIFSMYNHNEKLFVLNDVMATYRIHSNGAHGFLKNSKKGLIRAYLMHISFVKFICKNVLEQKYKKDIEKKIITTYFEIISLSKSESLRFQAKVYFYYLWDRYLFLKKS